MEEPFLLQYEREIAEIEEANDSYVEEILLLLLLLERTPTKRKQKEIMKQVETLSAGMIQFNQKWVDENIENSFLDGLVITLVVLGEMKRPQNEIEALALREQVRKKTLGTSQRDLVNMIKERTLNDILQTTENINRKTFQAMNKIISDQLMRDLVRKKKNLSDGEETKRIANRIKQQIPSELNAVITDKSGRKWKMKDYIHVVVTSQLMNASNEASESEGLRNGLILGRITSNPTKDACNFHLGRLVRLHDSVNAPYPSRRELAATRQIFHQMGGF